MDSIRVERLRCLSDTGDIQLKPITVLLGENSSGKSSFLRIFPLLKQSVEARTTGPILWNGRLVDFGTYETAHQNNSSEGIAFSFKFKLNSSNEYRVFSEYVASDSFIDDLNFYLTTKVKGTPDSFFAYVNCIHININNLEIEIEINSNQEVIKFLVNSLDVLQYGIKYLARQDYKNLLPTIFEDETDFAERLKY